MFEKLLLYQVRNKSGAVFYIQRGCVKIYPFHMKVTGSIEQTKLNFFISYEKLGEKLRKK